LAETRNAAKLTEPVQAPSSTPLEREIFLALLDVSDPRTRAECLASACGGDLELRRRLEELLYEEEQIGRFLETPALRPSARPCPSNNVATVSEPQPERIGRYRLLQRLGEGGCGIVYMADQEEPVRRRVAVKVIKAGMDTRSVIARFEAERQALALMDHPNIAKVLDAGSTENGRPYFVMELVRGIRITEYCKENNLATRERLELFIKVCHAIQHAHQKGIIHRDIKPSNILVTLHDGVPVPKVIDFGVAKAIQQRLTEKTVFTAFEQFIGTPAYMSPEQAEMSGLDIDTRTDIYSLGVLLYELLTGKTPFDGTELVQSGLDAMRRTIREAEPLRPSTRLQSLDLAEAVELVADRRETMPVLLKLVQGDLDWIVMKAVAKDRTRRYDTATAFALDVQNYLSGHTVTARPPSRRYQVQKFFYRNKLVLTAAASMAAVLVVASVVSTWQAYRATQAEHEQSYLRRLAEVAQQDEAKQRERAERERIAALRRAYDSDMNLIPQALQANNYGRVIDLLNRHREPVGPPPGARRMRPTDFRQWEWRYYWNQARSEAAFAFPKQSNTVETLVISPNGRWLVSSDRSGTVKLWDFLRRETVATLVPGFTGGRRGLPLAFSPHGERLALAIPGRRSLIKVFATSTARLVAEEPVGSGIQALGFSGDGTQLLFWGDDDRLHVFGGESPPTAPKVEPRRGLMNPFGRSVHATFSPDLRMIALIDGGHVRLVDTQTGLEKVSISAFEHAAALAFSPDGQCLAASPSFTETDTTIKLYSTATGQEIAKLLGHTSWVPALAFSPDGRRLISAGADQTLRIWDVANERETAVLRGHVSEVNSLALSPDGKTIVSGCKDGTIFGWETDRLERRKPFDILPALVSSFEFLPAGQGLLSVNRDGTVALWDIATLQAPAPITALGSGVERLLISPDGSRVFAGCRNGQIKVLNWTTRVLETNLGSMQGRRFPLIPVAVVNRGRTLVTAGAGGVRLWDSQTWQSKGLPHSQPLPARNFAVSNDERLLAMHGPDWTVDVVNLLSGRSEASFKLENWGYSGMAFSHDRSLLAISSGEGTISLWGLASKTVIDVLRGHLLGVHDVSFSPDGGRIASAGAKADEAVKLWDVASRHEVATLHGEGTVFQHLRFSPDGTILAAVNAQGRAHFWRAPSLQEIAALERGEP
jgi:WD40 repeat protein/serine/threonine protein kinase